jgi:aspartate aminotransferase
VKLANRMSRLGTETAFEVLARAKALEAKGVDVIHLEIGEPDFDTPSNITEAAVTALHEGYTHYCPSPGIPELREVIASHIARTRGVPVSADQVVVTPGGKPIMFFAITALVDEGDEVIYPNPGFPIYESMIEFVGGVAVPAPLREERAFSLDVDDLKGRITSRTKMIILNSPQNPTGGVIPRADVEAIAQLVLEHNLIVLSDEIYSDMIYDGDHFSITSLPGLAERTIILDGFSKTFAMTGWRMGYGVMPTELVPHISRLVTNSVSCTPPFIQRAGIEALTGPRERVNEMMGEFRKRRQIIVDGLNRIPGVSCVNPAGAFYAFPNVTGVGVDSKTFADLLLNEYGVATLSGTAFGAYGNGYLRLSYANSVANLERALERIEKAARHAQK